MKNELFDAPFNPTLNLIGMARLLALAQGLQVINSKVDDSKMNEKGVAEGLVEYATGIAADRIAQMLLDTGDYQTDNEKIIAMVTEDSEPVYLSDDEFPLASLEVVAGFEF